jgi:hypothetical protein
MLTIIIAPESAPQIFRPPPLTPPTPTAPRLDWIDELLLERLRDAGTCKTWSLLNSLTDEQGPRDRVDGRMQRLRFLDRLKRLRALGLMFSFGRNNLSDTKPSKRRSTVRRRRPTVAKSASLTAVSAPTKSWVQEARRHDNQGQSQMDKETSAPNPPEPDVEQTESAEEAQRISEAASALAHLPRNQPRKMTGWLHGQHCWRGRLLVLRDGEVAPLNWSSRGRVLLLNYKNMEVPDFLRWGAIREDDVRFHKSPEAVLLGSRKAGVKEQPSIRKQAAARANGCAPCRDGRKRGRPPKSFQARPK